MDQRALTFARHVSSISNALIPPPTPTDARQTALRGPVIRSTPYVRDILFHRKKLINPKKPGCALALYTQSLPDTFLSGPAGKGGAAQPSAVQGDSKLLATGKLRTPVSLLSLAWREVAPCACGLLCGERIPYSSLEASWCMPS